MTRLAIGLAAAGIVISSAAPAASPGEHDLVSDLLACRANGDAGARLACFDAASARLAEARDRKDIVVVDRNQIRETKRSLFGLSLPRLAVFGESSGEELSQLDATISTVRAEGDGSLTVALDNGSRWHQEDDRTIGFRIKAGDKVTIRRGALGAYFMSVAGHPGFRVRRLN
jgi:hypothetical protein